MANTQSLLTLVDTFPAAFADPEAHHEGAIASPDQGGSENARTRSLLTLVTEFPEAFADPEAEPPVTSPTPQTEVKEVEGASSQAIAPSLPAGYELSLNRTISTFTWGQIEAHLSYSASGLASLWLVAGKSGTEIQSLCEAICRLTNLLLAHQVPVDAIARQLRGIRGADSEGLGPHHRILGLADLIGKVLQEAPATLAAGVVAPVPEAQAVAAIPSDIPIEAVPDVVHSQNGASQAQSGSALLSSSLLDLSDNNHRMSICPECGSELQAMNGCSGGACQVCGFSSCS